MLLTETSPRTRTRFVVQLFHLMSAKYDFVNKWADDRTTRRGKASIACCGP